MLSTLPPRAHRSLMRLSATMGPEVLSLPIRICPRTSHHVAFTTHDSIYIREDVIQDEPQNIAVYVGHEILHHVLEDPFLRSSFHPDIVNLGTDFIINFILKKVYNLDVRKVKVKGVYDTRFRRKTLLQACAIVADENKGYHALKSCGAQHGVVTNPVIYEAARAIRERLMQHSMLEHLKLDENLQLVRLTKEEDQALYDELSDKYWRVRVSPIQGIDYNLLIRSLYARLFAKTVRYDVRKEVPIIGHSFGIALAVQVQKLREMTRGDAALSLIFAREFATVLSGWGTSTWKYERIGKLQNRIMKLQDKIHLRSRYSSSERSRFKESIKRAKIKMVKIEKTLPLVEYLTDENRLRLRQAKEKKETLAGLVRDTLVIKDDHLPRFRKNEMVDQVRKITRTIFRSLREIEKTREKLEKFVEKKKSSDVKSVEEKKKKTHAEETDVEETMQRQDIPRIPPKPLILRKVEQKEEERDDDKDEDGDDPKAGPTGPEVLPEDKEGDLHQEHEDGEVQQEHEDGEAHEDDEGDSTTDGDSELSDEPDSEEDEDEDDPVEAVANSESTKAGKDGEGSSVLELRMLRDIAVNNKLLKKILVEADVFRDKLSHAAKSHPHPDSLVDRTFTYGNEVQKADYSGLAKLATKATRLAFFADVGNHALLQHSGTIPKRGTVIIALDCSGSMAGDRYVLGAGFAVAMLRLMSDQGRGCALLKFSSNIDGMYVSDASQPVDMLTLIESLVNPSYGDTCFDAPFEQSIEIVDALKWRDPQMILVTDGYGEVTPGVMREATRRMRITGMVVKPQYEIDIEGINDIRYINSLEDLRNGLIQIGRAIC